MEFYKVNNTKLVNTLVGVGTDAANIKINGQEKSIKTSKSNKPWTWITITLSNDATEFSEEEQMSTALLDKPDPFDLAVHDAICTFIQDGQNEIPYVDIYRVLIGNPVAKVTEADVIKVRESVKRLSCIQVKIDFAKEPNSVRNHFSAKKIMQYHGPVLLFDEYKIKHHKQAQALGIRIRERPILLEYAEAWKHILSIPMEYLRVPVKMTSKNIAIRNYLYKYIGARKSKGLNNNSIYFKTILENSGYHISTRTETRKKEFETIGTMLQYFQELGYIVSWGSDYKSGKFVVEVR